MDIFYRKHERLKDRKLLAYLIYHGRNAYIYEADTQEYGGLFITIVTRLCKPLYKDNYEWYLWNSEF